MGALVFILLFLLGALVATIGGIIGVVDAFRVSTLWGVLALLVPFALLVFCIKFWRQRKWARNSLLMSLGGLVAMVIAIPLGGGIGMLADRGAGDQDLDEFTIEEQPSGADGTIPEPAAEPDGTAEVPAEAADGTEEEAELFEEAMLPGLPTAAEIARAELLPSTDPNERFNEIERERSDPYAFVPIPPPRPATPPPPANGGNGQPGGGNLPAPTNNQPGGGAAPPAVPTRPGGGQATTPGGGNAAPGGGGNAAPGGGNTTPGGGGNATPTEPLPELPPATVLASQVQVTGIADVDGKSYAIVKAPNEPTSRYVQVGDRIANGAVLVKRIENRAGTSPVVVLEERGEEIALPVGANLSAPETADEESPSASGQGVASLPVPQLSN